MRSELENAQLRKTIVEADKELTQWSHYLETNYYLELGSDPLLIDTIERRLNQLAQRIQILEPLFDVTRTSLIEADYYFVATERLDEAVKVVRSIREKSYGSRQYTRQCLYQITQCAESVRQVREIAFNTYAPVIAG